MNVWLDPWTCLIEYMPPYPMAFNVRIGKFTLKTAYQHLTAKGGEAQLPWEVIWNWYGPQRVKVFFWQLMHNGVMTNSERTRRHFANYDQCIMCGTQVENYMHLLRDCADARATWEGLIGAGDIEVFFDESIRFTDWIFWNLKSRKMYGSGITWGTIFGLGWWYIWKKRNGFVFKQERLTPIGVIKKVMRLAQVTTEAKERGGMEVATRSQSRMISWYPPPSGVMKLNSDASLAQGTNVAFGGGLIRDHLGNWRSGYVANIGLCSILKAELWCIMFGLQHAINHGVTKLEVECDNLVVVEMIMGRQEVNRHCSSLVANIRGLTKSFELVMINHLHREGNFMADFLSHFAYRFPRGVHEIDDPPNGVRTWLLHDIVGVSYER